MLALSLVVGKLKHSIEPTGASLYIAMNDELPGMSSSSSFDKTSISNLLMPLASFMYLCSDKSSPKLVTEIRSGQERRNTRAQS